MGHASSQAATAYARGPQPIGRLPANRIAASPTLSQRMSKAWRGGRVPHSGSTTNYCRNRYSGTASGSERCRQPIPLFRIPHGRLQRPGQGWSTQVAPPVVRTSPNEARSHLRTKGRLQGARLHGQRPRTELGPAG
eukprot:scaffold47897_cov63-Phaeocystis_antarctica.AAC.7